MNKISKDYFIGMVIDFFGFTERSRSHIEEIYKFVANNEPYNCKSSRDARIINYINGHIGDFYIVD